MKHFITITVFTVLIISGTFSQNEYKYDKECGNWIAEQGFSSNNNITPDVFSWQYYTVPGGVQLTDIFFYNDQLGWATHTGNGGFYSTNGGINWINISFSDTNFTTLYNGVYFINQTTGWMVGGSVQVRKTTNGGINWFKQNSAPVAGVLNSVYFFDENTGIASGRKGINYNSFIERTTNGGTNWTEIVATTATNNELSDQYWFDANTGWICGRDVLLKTTNGGLNYTNLYANVPPTSNGANALLSITFVNQNTGWIGGSNIDKKNLYITTNGGANWTFQDNPAASNSYTQINEVKFLSQDSGWAVHGTPVTGAIMFTTNAGVNWITEEGSSDWYDCLTYYQRIKAWCGAAGKVWYTSLLVNIAQTQNELPQKYNLYQNYPNPFNPVTKIKFDIPAESNVGITIYNILGKVISIVVNERLGQGSYEVNWDASNYPSGVYYYKLSAGNYNETKKMIILK